MAGQATDQSEREKKRKQVEANRALIANNRAQSIKRREKERSEGAKKLKQTFNNPNAKVHVIRTTTKRTNASAATSSAPQAKRAKASTTPANGEASKQQLKMTIHTGKGKGNGKGKDKGIHIVEFIDADLTEKLVKQSEQVQNHLYAPNQDDRIFQGDQTMLHPEIRQVVHDIEARDGNASDNIHKLFCDHVGEKIGKIGLPAIKGLPRLRTVHNDGDFTIMGSIGMPDKLTTAAVLVATDEAGEDDDACALAITLTTDKPFIKFKSNLQGRHTGFMDIMKQETGTDEDRHILISTAVSYAIDLERPNDFDAYGASLGARLAECLFAGDMESFRGAAQGICEILPGSLTLNPLNKDEEEEDEEEEDEEEDGNKKQPHPLTMCEVDAYHAPQQVNDCITLQGKQRSTLINRQIAPAAKWKEAFTVKAMDLLLWGVLRFPQTDAAAKAAGIPHVPHAPLAKWLHSCPLYEGKQQLRAAVNFDKVMADKKEADNEKRKLFTELAEVASKRVQDFDDGMRAEMERADKAEAELKKAEAEMEAIMAQYEGVDFDAPVSSDEDLKQALAESEERLAAVEADKARTEAALEKVTADRDSAKEDLQNTANKLAGAEKKLTSNKRTMEKMEKNLQEQTEKNTKLYKQNVAIMTNYNKIKAAQKRK